jgi:chromosome partitioning protein
VKSVIIVIASEKGGVGKSTLATNLAVISKSENVNNKDVVIVDIDPQSTSANWAKQREETDQPYIECIREYNDLTKILQDLKERFVIVDCPGFISQELEKALLVADMVVMPFGPFQFDLYTLPSMLELVEKARPSNPELIACAVITMCPTNSRSLEKQDAQEFFEEHPNVHLLKQTIHYRKKYREASCSGLGVTEEPNPCKASTEIHGLYLELKAIHKAAKKKESKL